MSNQSKAMQIFDGPVLQEGGCTHVYGIPKSPLLVSLNHQREKAAKMEIFDISKKPVKKIYSSEEILECNQDIFIFTMIV
mgnify:CR=1 FL=1